MVALYNPSQNVKYSSSQLAQFAANAGFSGNQVPTIVGIALAESGGNSQAQGDLGVGTVGSLGVLQINSAAHGTDVAVSSLDPQTAFNNAFTISHGGANFSPWSTFNNGAYQNFYDPSLASVSPEAFGGTTPFNSFNFPSLSQADSGFLSGANLGQPVEQSTGQTISNPMPPQTTPFDIGVRDVTAGTGFAPNTDFSNVPITDSSGNVVGTETTIPPDTLTNFGAIDPTAGSPFGGAFDSSGNAVAGSSGVGGLGLPDSFAGGTGGGGGLSYQVQPGKIASNNEASSGTPIEIPDVAKAVTSVGQGINTTLGATGTAIAKGLLGSVADAVTSFENWAGNYITRGGTMLFAIVLLAVAFYLLLPRGTKQQIVSTAT